MLQDSIMAVQRASILFNSVVENGPAFFHSEFTPAFEAEVKGAIRVRHTEGAFGAVCDKGAVSHSLLEGTYP